MEKIAMPARPLGNKSMMPALLQEHERQQEARRRMTLLRLQANLQRGLAEMLVGKVTLSRLTRRRLMASTHLKPNGKEI